MRTWYNCFFLFLLFSVYLNAQNGNASIKGKVLTVDNKPLAMASIILTGTPLGTTSEVSGNYQLNNIDEGSYTLRVSSVGYETSETKVNIPAGSSTILQDIILKEAAIHLNEITVAGDKDSYNTENISDGLRLKAKLLDIPQNIQVITMKTLDDQQIFNMIEGVTRNVSGVSRVEHWDNIYARLYTRGDHIPAYRNGMNIATTWGPLVEDMAMVERIEFVKGPAGFMLSNGEPGGFYNVVTKKPTNSRKSNYEITVGSFGAYRAAIDLDDKFDDEGKLLYRLNVMGQLRNSHVDYDYNNRYLIAPVLKYNFDKNTSLTFEYTYQHSDFLQPAAYVFSGKGYEDVPINFTTYDPNLEPTKINDHSLFVYLHHRLSSSWQITAQLVYFDNSIHGYDTWPGDIDSTGNLSRNLYVWDSSNKHKLGQVYVNGKIISGSIRHSILAGLDLGSKNSIADFGYAGVIPSLDIYNPQYGIPLSEIPKYDFSNSLQNRHNYSELGTYEAIYLQDELVFFENNLRLTIAGRYTHSQIDTEPFENVVTPRIGLSATLLSNTAVYGLYDQSFIPQSGEDFNGNHFKPVKGSNIEFGIKKDWFNNKWNSTIALYQITKTNVLNSDPEHINFSIQLGEIKTKGIEFDLTGEIFPGLEAIINYAYTDSKITKDTNPETVGNETPGSIKQIQNTWLTYRSHNGILSGLGLSIGYQYQIDRISWYVWDGSSQKLPDYFRLDGGISWQNERFKLGLIINNLLNDYLYSGFPPTAWYNFYTWITEAPRNFRLSLEFKL